MELQESREAFRDNLSRPGRTWPARPREVECSADFTHGADRHESNLFWDGGPIWSALSPTLSPLDTTHLERTLVLLKPDAVQRGLVGRILARFEEKGLQLVALKMRCFPEDLLRRHYDVHKERPFFEGLVKYMGSGPVVAMALQGVDAISVVRRLVGATNGRESAPGTIRGDFGMSFSTNLVHASDGPESAASELAMWFVDVEEVVEWTPADLDWRYNAEEELA